MIKDITKNEALLEKIELCLMLKEYYDEMPNELTLQVNSYKRKSRIKQIYFGFINVVLDNLDSYDFSLKGEVNEILKKKYIFGEKEISLKQILKDYRNKTFHNPQTNYYNNECLYRIEIIDCIDDINRLVNIYQRILESSRTNRNVFINHMGIIERIAKDGDLNE